MPKNKLIEYLRDSGKSIPNPNRQKKRKRFRYEGVTLWSMKISIYENDPYSIVWLGDASRMVLSYGEFPEATTDIAIPDSILWVHDGIAIGCMFSTDGFRKSPMRRLSESFTNLTRSRQVQ